MKKLLILGALLVLLTLNSALATDTEQYITGLDGSPSATALGYSTTYNYKAQSFNISGSGQFNIQSVNFYLRKYGSPTDNVEVEIQTDNAGEPSGTLAGSGYNTSIDGSTLTTSFVQYNMSLPANSNLTGNVKYWIVFKRSSSLSTVNYYALTKNNSNADYPGQEFMNYDSGILTWNYAGEAAGRLLSGSFWYNSSGGGGGNASNYTGYTKQLYTREAMPGVTISGSGWSAVDSFNFTVTDAGTHWVSSTLQVTGVATGTGRCRIAVNGTTLDSTAERTTTAGSAGNLQLMSGSFNLSTGVHTASVECQRDAPAQFRVDTANTYVHGMVASDGTTLSHSYARFNNITTNQSLNITTGTYTINGSKRYLVVEAKTDGAFSTTGVAVDFIQIDGVSVSNQIQRYGTSGSSGSWGIVAAAEITDSNATNYDIHYNISQNDATRNIWLHAYEVVLPEESINFNSTSGTTAGAGWTELYTQNMAYPIGGSFGVYAHTAIQLNITSGSDTASVHFHINGTNTTDYNRTVNTNAGVLDVVGAVDVSGSNNFTTHTGIYRSGGNMSYYANSLIMVTNAQTTAATSYDITAYDVFTGTSLTTFNATVNAVFYETTNGTITVPADQDSDTLTIRAENYFSNTTTSDGQTNTNISLLGYTEVRVVVNSGLSAPYNDHITEIANYVVTWDNGTGNGTITTNDFIAYTPLAVADYSIELRNLTNINKNTNLSVSGTEKLDALRGIGSTPGIAIIFYENVTLNSVGIMAGDGADTIQVWDSTTLLGTATVSGTQATFTGGLNLTKDTTYEIKGYYADAGNSYYIENVTGAFLGSDNDGLGLGYIIRGETWQNSTRANDVYAIKDINITSLTGEYANSDQNISITTYPRYYNFTTYLTNTINFYFKDEETDELITTQTVTYYVTGPLQSYNSTTSTGTSTVSLIVPQDYVITYSAPGYQQREYLFTLVNGSYNTLTLYLLNTTNDLLLTVTVEDTLANTISDAEVTAQRKNLSGTNYYSVGNCVTGVEGTCLLSMVQYDVAYRFRVVIDGVAQLFSSTGTTVSSDTKILSETITLRINLIEETYEEILQTYQVSGDVSYAPSPQEFTFTWADANNLGVTACLEVTRDNSGIITQYNSSCTTAASGTIVMSINESTGREFIAHGYIINDDKRLTIDRLSITTLGVAEDFGAYGLLIFGLLIAITAGLAGLSHPVLGPAVIALIIAAMRWTGLISWGYSAIGGLIILVIIIAYVIKK